MALQDQDLVRSVSCANGIASLVGAIRFSGNNFNEIGQVSENSQACAERMMGRASFLPLLLPPPVPPPPALLLPFGDGGASSTTLLLPSSSKSAGGGSPAELPS